MGVRREVERWMNTTSVEVTLLVLIVVSVVLTVLEVVVAGPLQRALMRMGDALTALFAVELLLRFWTARKKARFFERYWLDILSVLPLVRPLRFLRVLRVLRLFRAGMLFNRRVARVQLAGRTGAELMGLFLATVVLVVMSAMVLTVVEGEGNADFAHFDGSLWFAAYSLVGGEPIGGTPHTPVGRWTTLILMLGGLTLFGVFVGTVSAGMVAGLSRRLEVHELDIDELIDHVLVCGWNQSAPTVLRELFGANAPPGRAVVLVTEKAVPDQDLPQEVPADLLYQYIGDYTRVDVLEAVNLARADQVVLLADELIPRSAQDCDARTVLAALTVERMKPTVYTVAMLHSRQNEELLRLSGVEEIVVGDFFSGMIVGSVSRNRGLVQVLDEILTGNRGNSFHTSVVPRALAGRTVRELHAHLLDGHRAVLVSVELDGRVTVNPPLDRVLAGGERMVVLCDREVGA